jgi:hypothetical protein
VVLTAQPAPWRFEDGGPRRNQTVPGRLGVGPRRQLTVTTRMAPATTMVVGTSPQQLFLLRHTGGADAVSFVERIDAATLEPLAESPMLAGGPAWPGGIGVHDNGSIYVVFGNHAHRLNDELGVVASRPLPRVRPYNGFVVLPDGHLVTKDFAGSRPGVAVPAREREPAEVCVLDPDLEIVDRLLLPEPSIARLSADGDCVYIVGDTSLLRATWDGTRLAHDTGFAATYRTVEGQAYGWDCVIAAGFAWFLDNGDGSEGFSGTLRGHGLSTAPLHLVRVDLGTGEVAMAEVCGLEGGLVANPPVVDERRRVVVGYDSGNGVVTGFDLGTLEQRWQRHEDHGAHLLLYEDSGELVTGDNADVVVLDVSSGTELARADTGSGVQSVLFPSPGFEDDFYLCSLLTVSRVVVGARGLTSPTC